MNAKEEAFTDWLEGMKYKDIAAKYKVSENTVKSWATRYWKKENPVATINKKLQHKLIKMQPKEVATKAVVKAMIEKIENNEELNDEQKEFCIRYMQNRNAPAAYFAVYGGKYETALNSGYRLLNKPEIQQELKNLRKIKNAALGFLCGDDVVEMHMRIAFADIKDFISYKSEQIPVLDKYGNSIFYIDPETGKELPLTYVKTKILARNSDNIDGSLVSEITDGRDGFKIKLADRMKSLQFLERYFLLNPNDRHRIEYDDKKLELENRRIENCENDAKELVEDWINNLTDEEVAEDG